MDLSDLLSALVGLLAGYGLKVVVDRRITDKSRASVNQSGSVVGGDQVGRDINEGHREQ
jgi:hypothetical protein